jgi:hypothetical protein
MRGYTKTMGSERAGAPRRAELDGGSHLIIQAARQALADTIERYAAPGIDPRALRAAAITGLFADTLSSFTNATTAPAMVEVINRQLATVGLQLTLLPRN